MDSKTETVSDIAIEALHKIAYPISHMQLEAEREGKQLDGLLAVLISKDPEYLKGIARRALFEINSQSPDTIK